MDYLVKIQIVGRHSLLHMTDIRCPVSTSAQFYHQIACLVINVVFKPYLGGSFTGGEHKVRGTTTLCVQFPFRNICAIICITIYMSWCNTLNGNDPFWRTFYKIRDTIWWIGYNRTGWRVKIRIGQIAVKQVVCFCFSKRQAFTHPLPLCILSAIDTVIYWRFFYRIDFFQQVGIFNPILRRIGRGVVGDNQRGYITGYNHVDLFHVCYIRIIRNLEIRCRKSHARLCLEWTVSDYGTLIIQNKECHAIVLICPNFIGILHFKYRINGPSIRILHIAGRTFYKPHIQ